MYSKLNKEALKSIKTYVNDDVWHCYWHGLSGDELVNQIFTVAHKPSDVVYSLNFTELSSLYKLDGAEKINEFLHKVFDVGVEVPVQHVLQFLNDAKIEYTNKPFFKETA
jgi:hypothetical protein